MSNPASARFLTIAGRAIATMIHYSGYNDILRIYATAKRDGVDYNLAYIEPDFPRVKHERFDPAYLRALFQYGYAKGRQRSPWHKAPPNVETAAYLNTPIRRGLGTLTGCALPALMCSIGLHENRAKQD